MPMQERIWTKNPLYIEAEELSENVENDTNSDEQGNELEEEENSRPVDPEESKIHSISDEIMLIEESNP